MYANAIQSANCARPQTQVDRLGEAIEHIEKALFGLTEKLDPVLRPSEACALAGEMKACPIIQSRLASLVDRLFAIPTRIAGMADRVDA